MPNFKALFVKRVLQDEGQRYLKNQGIAIQKRVNFHTGDLFNNRSAKVTGDDSMDGQLSINHTIYERFLDIKKKIRSRKTNKIKTRSLKIHNVYAFGHYYSIANRLMNEYTDEARAAIIKDFNTLNNG